jgi:hypothetical protein
MLKRLLFFFLIVTTKANATAIVESSEATAPLMLTPAISLIGPNALTLTNSHFSVPYLESMTGFPLVTIQLSDKVLSTDRLDIFLAAGLGYGLYQGDLALQSANGASIGDYLHLHWVPFSLATTINFKIPEISFVRPGIQVGAGVDWLIQAGSVDGVTDSFWLPVISFTPMLTFFESEHKEGDWFGGFTFGVSYQTCFATTQSFNAWSIQIGQNILF